MIGNAQLAAIQAAKRTDQWIPLAHTLPLNAVDVDIDDDAVAGTVIVTVTAPRTCRAPGVEMEAMTSDSAAGALSASTDVVKGLERGVVVERRGAAAVRAGWIRFVGDVISKIEPLRDGHRRLIGDLRVSVTDRCIFRCQYCMPAEGLPWLSATRS